MLINKSFRYRIYPNAKQIARLHAWQDALRFLWNLALEQWHIGLSRPKGEKIYPSVFDQINDLTELRAQLPWLADVPYSVSSQLLIDLNLAWQRCFKCICDAPNFKKKNGKKKLGFKEPNPKVWSLKSNILRFPKLGNLPIVFHSPLQGKAKSCTIREDAGQWFASIVCEIEVVDPIARIEPIVAIDRGVINLVADSDGNLIINPRHRKAATKELRRADRSIHRKKKGSKNREKAKLKLAKIHQKIRRQRENTLHKISSKYSKSHAIIVVEKLMIENMTASAAGTVENPGKNVKQKSGLNRSILDCGWGMLVNQLRYKLSWNGGSLVEVPAAYSSQTCNVCQHTSKENRETQDKFACVACGYEENADVNAAKVLLQRYKTPGNPWCQPMEGSSQDARRDRKRLNVVRRKSKVLSGI